MKMEAKEVLNVVLREMCAYGEGWRNDWSNFDGRYLRRQLNALAGWAEKALASEEVSNYTVGSEFEARRS